MNPLEEQLRNAAKKFSIGEITTAEMEEMIDRCNRELGESAVDRILGGDPAEGEVNLAEMYDKFLQLEKHSKEEWAKISKDYKFENEQLIGKYLVAYIKMEYFVNALIKEEFQHKGILVVQHRQRLPFPVKLDLLRIEGREYLDYLNLAEELNHVRNKLAHDLRFDFLNHKPKEISKFINPNLKLTAEEKLKHLVELIHLCCYYFQLETEPMRKKADEIFNKDTENKN